MKKRDKVIDIDTVIPDEVFIAIKVLKEMIKFTNSTFN